MLSYNKRGIDFDEYVERMTAIRDAVNSVSGGGFNYEYFAETDGKDIAFYTYYDYMDENGYYDAVIAFSIIVDISTADFKISLTPQNTPHAKYIYKRDGLKDFFEDTYAQALSRLTETAFVTWKAKNQVTYTA